MNPEREIINQWLSRKGFFTIDSIPLENNRIIDILAVKITGGNVSKVMHIETACTISSLDNVSMAEFEMKFNDKNVVRKVKSTIRESLGIEAEYDKVLVIGSSNRLADFKALDGIRTIKFEDILFDTMAGLNKQSYRNEVVRTLQLVKYLLLSKPTKAAEIIGFNGPNKFLTQMEREEFIRMLLTQGDVKRILGKKSMEHAVANVLSESTLARPEKLAEAIEGSLMNSRAKRKFQKLMIAKQEIKVTKKQLQPKEKSLEIFFG